MSQGVHPDSFFNVSDPVTKFALMRFPKPNAEVLSPAWQAIPSC